MQESNQLSSIVQEIITTEANFCETCAKAVENLRKIKNLIQSYSKMQKKCWFPEKPNKQCLDSTG